MGRRVVKRGASCAAAAIVFLAGTGTSVTAQVHEARTKLGLDLGRAEIDAGSFQENATRWNLRLGQEFSPTFEAELTLFGAKAEENPLPDVTRSVDHLVLSANLIYNFRLRETASPYLLVGTGVGRLEFEALGLSASETALSIQGAGGCRWKIGKERRSRIRLELSLAFMQAVSWTNQESEGDVRSLSLSVGYEYVLGRAGT